MTWSGGIVRLGLAASLALSSLSCEAPRPGSKFELRPTRGYVLISLDTLRADRLSSYGHELPTSPFFDELAGRGFLFENVAATYPATLVSHMSMFTGLYPPQHGVYPPAMVLPEGVWTLAQAMRRAGFRTQAHTEGGFMARGYGFERGFEVYDDSVRGDARDVATTFERGLRFLSSLAPDERFFLFLHSYSVHDPYDPPSEFVSEFDGPQPLPDSRGERLRAFNLERTEIERSEIERFSRLYDASVRYTDSMVEQLVEALRESELLADTTLVITSDHGEEFLEHGKLAHTQLYPEVLAVPLLVLHPDQSTPRRIGEQVSLVDLAPTLADLAGLDVPEGLGGVSLVPHLENSAPADRGFSYAEVDETDYLRTLIGEVEGVRYQLLVEGSKPDAEGVWVGEVAELDVFGPQLAFRSRSYHRPRRVKVRVDGEVVADLEVTPDWQEFSVDLPGAELQRVELETSGCLRPVDVGESRDSRCLGFIVRGLPLIVARLFDLEEDPMALADLSRQRPWVTRRMMRALQDTQWTAVGGVNFRELSVADRQRLKALGYLD